MRKNSGKLKIGVKYCGGCNPEYDRVALVEHIKSRLRGKAIFVSLDSEGIELVLAVQGCRSACANLKSFEGLKVVVITSPEDAKGILEAEDIKAYRSSI
jgi:predicted Fe-Mo cluster-binding NifX family protein